MNLNAVAMVGLTYPIATFISHSPQTTPKNPTIHSSIPSISSPSKLTKRKNYLRGKILKTLTKPHRIPLSPPISEEPISPVDPNLEDSSEPTSEKQISSFGQESEVLFDAKESSLDEAQFVQVSEGKNLESFNVFSGRMIVRIIASVVGLFVLQTVVSVWITSRGDSDEKDRILGVEGQRRNLRLGMRNGENRLNANGFSGIQVSKNVGNEFEVEAKVAEIRKMAKEARKVEKKERLEGDESDVTDISNGDDDLEGSRIQNGVGKEVDKRLTRMKKRSPIPAVNVNLMNKAEDMNNNNNNNNHKEEDNMLMFDRKRKYRSHLNTARDKVEGFQGIEGGHGVGEKPIKMNDHKPIQIVGNVISNGDGLINENEKVNDLDSSYRERINKDIQIGEKKPNSGSSGPLQTSKKGFGSNGTAKKLNKSKRSKIKSGSKKAQEDLDKRVSEDAEPQRGVVQDSSSEKPMDDRAATVSQDSLEKVNNQDALTSKVHDTSLKMQTNPQKLGSKQSLSRDNDLWWLNLPYVFVILMQIDLDSEGQRGFYTMKIASDAEDESYTPYLIAFEHRIDAMNFSYLLESSFADLPDATVDVLPLPAKDLKEVVESLNKEVIVVKKGELQLFIGQPLEEVESALESLVK